MNSTPAAAFLEILRGFLQIARWRAALLLVLLLSSAFFQGAGLMLLIPLLEVIALAGPGG